MRKFMLALAGAAVVLGAGMLTTPSGATTLAGPAGMRAAVTEGSGIHKARFACTHFWNGRYHRRAVCVGHPGYRHHYHERHRH